MGRTCHLSCSNAIGAYGTRILRFSVAAKELYQQITHFAFTGLRLVLLVIVDKLSTCCEIPASCVWGKILAFGSRYAIRANDAGIHYRAPRSRRHIIHRDGSGSWIYCSRAAIRLDHFCLRTTETGTAFKLRGNIDPFFTRLRSQGVWDIITTNGGASWAYDAGILGCGGAA
jgi:hypothetical protein